MKAEKIIEIYKRYTNLTQNGKWLRGLCPLHNDTNPSFYVNIETLNFGCFGCGNRGGIRDFLKIVNGWSEEETDEFLGGKTNESYKNFLSKYNIQIEKLCNDEEALQFLNNRNITTEDIKKFKLALHNNEIFNFKTTKKTIVIPYRNPIGIIEGFKYRILEDKYISENKNCYGFGFYDSIKLCNNNYNKEVVIVEGAWDAIALLKHNIPSISIDTSILTTLTIQRIKRYFDNIILCPDADISGWNSIFKNILLLIKENIYNIYVCILPCSEPSELDFSIVKNSLENKIFWVDYIINSIFSEAKIIPYNQQVNFIINKIIPYISCCNNVLKEIIISYITEKIHIDKNSFFYYINTQRKE